MTGTIEVTGIETWGYHGCLAEEIRVAREFVVDVVIECDMTAVVESDELVSTVNYVEVIEIVKQEMAIPSKMIEHAAGRIIKALNSAIPGIDRVTVKLDKKRPPINGNDAAVAVVLHG